VLLSSPSADYCLSKTLQLQWLQGFFYAVYRKSAANAFLFCRKSSSQPQMMLPKGLASASPFSFVWPRILKIFCTFTVVLQKRRYP